MRYKNLSFILLLMFLLFLQLVAAQRSVTLDIERGYKIYHDTLYYDTTYFMPIGSMSDMPKVLRNRKVKKLMKQKMFMDQKPKGRIVQGVNLQTFQSLSGNYGKDDLTVFYRGEAIKGADATTFEQVEPKSHSHYFKDKHHVYYCGQVKEEGDAATFRYLSTYYSIDTNHIYYNNEVLDIPPDYCRLLDDWGIYLGVGDHVYYYGRLLKDARPENFRLLGNDYVTDGELVFYKGSLVEGAHALTFGPLRNPKGGSYYCCPCYDDVYGIYCNGKKIQGSGPNSRALNSRYLVSGGKVFYDLILVEEANAATFQAVSDHFGKDAHAVYLRDKRLDGADAASFRSFDYDIYMDNSHVYTICGQRIAVDVATFKHVKDKNRKIIYRDKKQRYVYDMDKESFN